MTRAGDGASFGDADGVRDDRFRSVDDAWFCRGYPRIAQECRTILVGAMLLDRKHGRLNQVEGAQIDGPFPADSDPRATGLAMTLGEVSFAARTPFR